MLLSTANITNALPQYILCILFVIASVIVSQVTLTMFHVWANKKKLAFHNEVAGIVFGGISLIYSLILAFVIVAVWDDYNHLNKTIEEEADKLNSILAHTTSLSRDVQVNFDTAIFNYCNEVINKEWQMKEEGDARPSAIPCLRRFILTREPANDIEKNIFSVIDNDLSSISDLRRDRLGHSHSQVPGMVWFILDAGTIMLILFFFFLSVPSLKLKRIYLSFFVSCMAMCMFLIYTLDHPFSNTTGISNQLYKNIQLELKSTNSLSPCDAYELFLQTPQRDSKVSNQ